MDRPGQGRAPIDPVRRAPDREGDAWKLQPPPRRITLRRGAGIERETLAGVSAIAQPLEHAADGAFQLLGRAIHRLLERRRLLRHRHRRPAVEARFDHAALVVAARLAAAVLVAEVHLHARDAVAEPAERALNE